MINQNDETRNRIPSRNEIRQRIATNDIKPKEIASYLCMSERQVYRLINSYTKKDRATISYVLNLIDNQNKKGDKK